MTAESLQNSVGVDVSIHEVRAKRDAEIAADLRAILRENRLDHTSGMYALGEYVDRLDVPMSDDEPASRVNLWARDEVDRALRIAEVALDLAAMPRALIEKVCATMSNPRVAIVAREELISWLVTYINANPDRITRAGYAREALAREAP